MRTATKGALGTKAVKTLAKNPGLLKVAPPATKVGWRLAKPLAKRRARKRVQRLGDTTRDIVMLLANYGPPAARALGIIEEPKPKSNRALILMGTGAVLGATTIYFFEPGQGREHREKVARLVS